MPERKRMKKVLLIICLFLAGCNHIDYLCYNTDPNQMTEREFELCKAYLSRSETIITNNNEIKK